ncbi:hypothetical protein AQPW35_53790 [Rubrivivax pictus]|uniref:Uncharacterized protein n=1 Tax=Pseudaquabacterium pictum TaxID=2315236 RepID=A0A480B5E0_9BURK|nr:hypothetical protein AQPW35_53790 [Rubrivivax pictus]
MPIRSKRRVWPLALLTLLLLVAGTLVVGLWLAIERAPRVDAPRTAVSLDDVARARDLLRQNDPRRALPGIMRAVVLSQRDLELLLQQVGQRLGGAAQTARGRVRLQPGLAVVEASLPLAAWPGGLWLNLRAVLRETDGLPTVQALRIGRLPLPGWLAQAALPRLLETLNLRTQGELAQKMVSRVGFRAQTLVLAYAWPDNAEQVLTASLLTPDIQTRLRRHAEHLANQLQPQAGRPVPRQGLPVTPLLASMFQLAARHSPDAATAALENRAALVALAFLASGQRLQPWLGTPTTPVARPRGRPTDLLLQGRPDFPQHLLISAALAAEGGGPLADAIGLYKEVADARHGSGFSFRDIAADRAGTRLGLRARHDPLGFQARMAQGLTEADLLPDVGDLPEFMSADEFQRRFGGVGAPAYQAMLRDIETRLDRLPLLAPVR